MSTPVIKVENLSKQYRLGAAHGYKTFRETIVNATKAPLDRLKKVLGKSDNGSNPMPRQAPGSLRPPDSDTIWALKDVSFDVQQGEVVGVIGRNGAGKSTLLKILSKITEPTRGRVELKGRVGSLLEVGTGFHPELTGHENIYLYGAILGMDRWEVTRKFDEIVAFAEIEKFIETPVKRYSSGMYMRLAFAVAAHLEPEILLIDEVLAVGDAAFQKKCLGKMGEVSKEGRTVLFVSHNMGAIQSLCSEAILIEDGTIVEKGNVQANVRRYLSGGDVFEPTLWLAERQRTRLKNHVLEPYRLALVDEDNNILPSVFQRNQQVFVEFEFYLYKSDRALTIGISLFNQEGVHIFRSLHTDTFKSLDPIMKVGRNILRMRLPTKLLNEGNYRAVLDGGLHKIQWLYNPFESDVSVKFSIKGGLSQSPYWLHGRLGVIAPSINWKIIRID
jgi:lipopolysaccharide transport system ATP-binding protein